MVDAPRPETITTEYTSRLRFRVEGAGRNWEDVLPEALPAKAGILLFAERTRDALLAEGIRGLSFYEAQIVQVMKNSALAKKCPPRYYWAKASGVIVYDYEVLRAGGPMITTQLIDAEGSDFLHALRDKGEHRRPSGYVCTFRVLEVCRKHRIENLQIYPIDYHQTWPGRRTPFRIPLLGQQWPPQWYPEGFTPHPSNQEDTVEHRPITPLLPVEDEAPEEVQRAAHTFDWTMPQPIDQRVIDPTLYSKLRELRMDISGIERLETELHLQVPQFLRKWFLENPFRNSDRETRALLCDADLLIRENVDLRRKGYCERLWPESLLCIGDDETGGVYFVNTASVEPAVYHFHPEDGQEDVVLADECERQSPEEFIRFVME